MKRLKFMQTNLQEEMRKKYAKIVAKAWVDEDYKNNLLNNTERVLKDEGFEIPAGLKIKIIEEPENTKIFVLPQIPDNLENIENLENRIVASCCDSEWSYIDTFAAMGS